MPVPKVQFAVLEVGELFQDVFVQSAGGRSLVSFIEQSAVLLFVFICLSAERRVAFVTALYVFALVLYHL